jgi:hypothetical protein
MEKIKNIIGKINLFKKIAIKKKVKKLKPGKYFVNPKPVYISQLADAKEENIEKFYGQINDRNAQKKFGVKSKKDFSFWAWRSCALACSLSVIKTKSKKEGKKDNTKIYDLVKEGLKIKGYKFERDVGWYHDAIVKIAKRHGILSERKSVIATEEIVDEILNNNYILSSVKSPTGGHLILIYGFEIDKNGKIKGFWYHNPYNYKKEGKSQFIKLKEFENIFKGRIIKLNINGK